MPNIAHPTAIARIGRTLLSRSGNPSTSDDELLGRFLDTRDADAFAALVARHGPMVYAVCRRVMGDLHRADDAFQATFLILARRAGDVKPAGAVRAWLYGVAVRTALTARARTGHRLKREIPVASVPDRAVPVRTDADSDVLRMLDEEIALLPDKLRAAVVLCELDGLSRKDAATRLRITEGTLSSRLAAARKALAARLKARGVSIPVAALSTLFARTSTASAVPGALTEAAACYSTRDVVPPGVDELTRGVFKSLLLAKITASIGGAVLLIGVLVTAALAAAPSETDPREPPPAIPARLALVPTFTLAPVPRPAQPREGVILVTSHAKDRLAELYKPDGTLLGKPAMGSIIAPDEPRLSPDAKRLAVFEYHPRKQEDPSPWARYDLYLLDLEDRDGPKEPILSGLQCPATVWSPDGTKLYGSQVNPEKENEPGQAGKAIPVVSWVYDLKTRKKTPLAVPEGHRISDISADGTTLLTWIGDSAIEPSEKSIPRRTYLVSLATLEARPLTKGSFLGFRFSPNGKSVIGHRFGKALAPCIFTVVSVADGSERRVKLPADVEEVGYACWSPDGKRIAYRWHDYGWRFPAPPGQDPPPLTAYRITVADQDGGNAKAIIRREDANPIYGLDWR